MWVLFLAATHRFAEQLAVGLVHSCDVCGQAKLALLLEVLSAVDQAPT